jgi:hypothetical protein
MLSPFDVSFGRAICWRLGRVPMHTLPGALMHGGTPEPGSEAWMLRIAPGLIADP